MLPWQWILMAAVAAALVILGVLVLAAVAASRSRPRPEQLTPTQRTQNPYPAFTAVESRRGARCSLGAEIKSRSPAGFSRRAPASFLSVCNEAHSMLGCFLRQTGCGESCRPMESTPAQWESRAKERRRLGRAPASSCATA